MSLTIIRQHLASITRAGHADPPHGADGKFYSGGSSDKALGFTWGHPPNLVPSEMTPAQRELAQSAVNPHGATSQCSYCTRMNNGPRAGQRLGFQMTIPGVHINDSVCVECKRRTYIAYFRGKGLSAKEARRRAEALMHPKQTERLTVARTLLAQVTRGGMSGGRTPNFAIGADGRNHFAGSTAGDGPITPERASLATIRRTLQSLTT